MVSRVMFSRRHWEACSFLREDGARKWSWRRGEGRGAGKSGGRGSYGQDVLYERRNYEHFKGIQDSLLLEFCLVGKNGYTEELRWSMFRVLLGTEKGGT